jgi:hypothetical protein
MFLQDNPLIFQHNGSLCGMVFVDTCEAPLSENDLRRLDRDFCFDGLSQLLIVQLDSPSRPVTIPPDLIHRMTVQSLSELLGAAAI